MTNQYLNKDWKLDVKEAASFVLGFVFYLMQFRSIINFLV